MAAARPVVLCFSGLDPSGGAGLQADIETSLRLGCHCAPIATTLTVQDTSNAGRMVAVSAGLLEEQARAVLADMPVRCFKLGLLGGAAAVRTIAGILRDHAGIPVVIDPVGAAGGGFVFADAETTAALAELLLPMATVATPNTEELMQLAPSANSVEDAARQWLGRGCRNLLVTGGHEAGGEVVNRWFHAGHAPREFRWPRLPHEFHGSGCTLASAVAANLALGHGIQRALAAAQEFTFHALEQSWRAGAGQRLPGRGSAAAP